MWWLDACAAKGWREMSDEASGLANAVATAIVLRDKSVAWIRARHPWVRSSAIEGEVQLWVGEVVDVVDGQGRFLARGLANPASHLRVRVYAFRNDCVLDASWFCKRLDEALGRRAAMPWHGADHACRLVFSEADGLSGLIVDRYGPYLVVQWSAAALQSFLDPILDHLQSILSPRGILLRVDEKTAKAEGLAVRDEVVRGVAPDAPVEVSDGGARWLVDLLHSQKTGLYLDQRDNRLAAARYLRDRAVLDVCCYTGGFGLVAAIGGARSVIGVDSSARALQAAAAHASINGVESQCQWVQADCFEWLQRAVAEGSRFDAVVLDPPRFAGSQTQVDAALRAYHRLNRMAVELLPPGGILVTSSCSGRVTRSDFLNMLVGVGQQTGRDLTILEHRTAAADHPVRLGCPETDYLKCVIATVDG
jgi:23S rRNA (cytosine1962-C5)-methyltransferase